MTSPNDATEQPKPVVEPSPVSPDPVTRALRQRIRQQEILAELGVVALQGKPFPELLNETVRLTAEGMNAEFCKVLEYIPAEKRLLVRSGVWGGMKVSLAGLRWAQIWNPRRGLRCVLASR